MHAAPAAAAPRRPQLLKAFLTGPCSAAWASGDGGGRRGRAAEGRRRQRRRLGGQRRQGLIALSMCTRVPTLSILQLEGPASSRHTCCARRLTKRRRGHSRSQVTLNRRQRIARRTGATRYRRRPHRRPRGGNGTSQCSRRTQAEGSLHFTIGHRLDALERLARQLPTKRSCPVWSSCCAVR